MKFRIIFELDTEIAGVPEVNAELIKAQFEAGKRDGMELIAVEEVK